MIGVSSGRSTENATTETGMTCLKSAPSLVTSAGKLVKVRTMSPQVGDVIIQK